MYSTQHAGARVFLIYLSRYIRTFCLLNSLDRLATKITSNLKYSVLKAHFDLVLK